MDDMRSSWNSLKKAKLYGWKPKEEKPPKKRRKKRYGPTKEFVDKLRNNMTSAERLLWSRIESQGYFSQIIILRYVVDFYHPGKGICVEVDGSIHDLPDQKMKDLAKDQELTSHGYHVIRFTNRRVFEELDSVLEELCSYSRKM